MKNIFKLKNLFILAAVAALAYGGYYFGTQNADTSSSSKTLELTTVAIQKGDLEKKEEYNGTLRQTDKKVLNSPTNGVVTFLPKEGTIISFGEILFIIDNKPVILLEGSTPFYRTLDLNSDPGVDIKQVEEALVYLGYAESSFVPDNIFDAETSQMLNKLYIDYEIETKSEITPSEQVLINQKENAAWQAADAEIERIRNLIDELNYESMSEETRAGKKAAYEEDIKTQERIQSREAGKESGIDATEALAIENAQKAYDEALESYNEGVNREAELEKAKAQTVKNQTNIQVNSAEMPFGQGNYGELMKKLLKDK